MSDTEEFLAGHVKLAYGACSCGEAAPPRVQPGGYSRWHRGHLAAALDARPSAAAEAIDRDAEAYVRMAKAMGSFGPEQRARHAGLVQAADLVRGLP